MNSIRIRPITAGLVAAGVALLTVARGQQVQQVIRITREQSEILSHMSIVYIDDGEGSLVKTIADLNYRRCLERQGGGAVQI